MPTCAVVTMPEATYPDNKLIPKVFEAWLRHRFNDNAISVQVSLPVTYVTTRGLPTDLQIVVQERTIRFQFAGKQGANCC